MKQLFLILLSVALLIALAGCEGISTPYVMKTDRTDQNLSVGNRGYLKGTPPPPKDRGELKREFIAIDIDLAEGGKEEAKPAEEKPVEGKRNIPVRKKVVKEEVK